jgi:putative lipase involved disintegration of autophagic bodies
MAADGGENGWEILVTGHSLGGALATLCSPDLQLLMPEASPSQCESKKDVV